MFSYWIISFEISFDLSCSNSFLLFLYSLKKVEYSATLKYVFFTKFSGIETINDDLYTTSLIPIFKYLITLKSRLDSTITNIDIDTKVSKENFCWVLFFKKADLIAIIKSSLTDSIGINIQST